MRPGRLFPAALTKELRAIAPGWLACLALFATAALFDQAWSRRLIIAVYFVAPTALGAMSMGHEYNGGTLTLLLSQPRRRENIWLLKLGALALMLPPLGAAGFLLGMRPQDSSALLFVLLLLCGLFIAPWFTMLCRNPLAGIVFTLSTPAVVMVIGEIAAAAKFGSGVALGADRVAYKSAVLWQGMLAISMVAAVSSWRSFMRLQAIDGRGHAIQLKWLRAGKPTIAKPLRSIKRRPIWLLAKKELRLQQLSFVVSGLYVLGWFGVWSARGTINYPYVPLLFALTALNILAVSVLAGSLASAEERQFGTLEWHALLPMSARAQWAMKVGTTVGVACVLGLALPMVLVSVTGSREIHDAVKPLLQTGVGFAVIFLSVMSLYASSLCANSLQALLLSVAAGFGLMTFTNRWFLTVFRLGADLGFDPFASFGWRLGWGPNGRLSVLLILMRTLAVLMYAGALGLLLRFAQSNHRSAERSSRRMSTQLVSLSAFLAIVLVLWSGVSNAFRVEAVAYQREFMLRRFGFVTLAAVDSGSKPMTRYTLVVFPENRSRYGGSLLFLVDPARWPRGQVETPLVPGRYSVVAVEQLPSESELTARRDPETIARLRARAIPLTIAAGESKTLNVTVSR